ncbi:MAG: TetR/AcrR family transcriptional regulator [Dehalococcoidia bacterium]
MEKVLTRREEIYQAAARLFFKKGYHATGMRELAKAVGIDQAVLYYYYPSKAEILYDIMKTGTFDLMKSVDDALHSTQTPSEKLMAFLTVHMSHFLRRREEVGMSFIEFRNLNPEQQAELRQWQSAYLAKFRSILEQGIEEGAFQPIDAKTVTMLLLAGTTSVAAWYHPSGPLDPEQMAAVFADVVTQGILQRKTTVN